MRGARCVSGSGLVRLRLLSLRAVARRLGGGTRSTRGGPASRADPESVAGGCWFDERPRRLPQPSAPASAVLVAGQIVGSLARWPVRSTALFLVSLACWLLLILLLKCLPNWLLSVNILLNLLLNRLAIFPQAVQVQAFLPLACPLLLEVWTVLLFFLNLAHQPS